MQVTPSTEVWTLEMAHHCSHPSVEWHWLRNDDRSECASFGFVVCHPCRQQLYYTNVPGFVAYLTRTLKQYVDRQS